ncbi:MAG TPA: hypothetical protein VGR84_13180, partial [Candidatus Acidoferrales bacterium]|nr:hypothetical protein [Candidatus Acidoferrales bacterium]
AGWFGAWARPELDSFVGHRNSPWRFSFSGSLEREACDQGIWTWLPDAKMMNRCWRKGKRWRLWKMLRPDAADY